MKESAADLIKSRKWKDFLMAVPLNKPSGYYVANANDLYTLRVRASQLSKSDDCDRTFSITADLETKIITVTARQKDGTV